MFKTPALVLCPLFLMLILERVFPEPFFFTDGDKKKGKKTPWDNLLAVAVSTLSISILYYMHSVYITYACSIYSFVYLFIHSF